MRIARMDDLDRLRTFTLEERALLLTGSVLLRRRDPRVMMVGALPRQVADRIWVGVLAEASGLPLATVEAALPKIQPYVMATQLQMARRARRSRGQHPGWE